MNRIEAMKAARDGLDVQEDLIRFAREGWRTIADDDKERLKWAGVFMRKPTPGHFMMRVRMPNGVLTSAQARELAAILVGVRRGLEVLVAPSPSPINRSYGEDEMFIG